MKHYLKYILTSVLLLTVMGFQPLAAENAHEAQSEKELNVKELILDHLADAYEWH
jgi:hypothetical protein